MNTFFLELTKEELEFIINATFSVNISSKDAKFVGEVQQKLVTVLTTPVPESKIGIPDVPPAETT
jgi:hypothetical protein